MDIMSLFNGNREQSQSRAGVTGTQEVAIVASPNTGAEAPAWFRDYEAKRDAELAARDREIAELRAQLAAVSAKANSAQVSVDVPANTSAGMVDVTAHKGPLTQYEGALRNEIRSLTGWANNNAVNGVGYTRYVVEQGGRKFLNVAAIRADMEAAGKGNGQAPTGTVAKPKSPPKAQANVPGIDLSDKRFTHLRLFDTATNANHAHWTGTLNLVLDGQRASVTLTDFPYDLSKLAGRPIPRTCKTLLTARFAKTLLQLSEGERTQLSMAIAQALGAKSNGEYAHAFRGYRSNDDWLKTVANALG